MAVVTEAALGRRASVQVAAVERAAERAKVLIGSKLEDAGAHAARSITEALREAASERKAVSIVRRSRSFEAAARRLAELGRGLAELVEGERERFLVESWEFWAPVLGGSRAKPPGGLRAAIRGAALHGYTLRGEIDFRIQRAQRTLEAATVRAAAAGRFGPKLLRAWEDASLGSILAGVAVLLSDSAILAEQVATWYLIPSGERPDAKPPLDY